MFVANPTSSDTVWSISMSSRPTPSTADSCHSYRSALCGPSQGRTPDTSISHGSARTSAYCVRAISSRRAAEIVRQRGSSLRPSTWSTIRTIRSLRLGT